MKTVFWVWLESLCPYRRSVLSFTSHRVSCAIGRGRLGQPALTSSMDAMMAGGENDGGSAQADIQQPKRQALPAEAARKLMLDLVCGVLS